MQAEDMEIDTHIDRNVGIDIDAESCRDEDSPQIYTYVDIVTDTGKYLQVWIEKYKHRDKRLIQRTRLQTGASSWQPAASGQIDMEIETQRQVDVDAYTTKDVDIDRDRYADMKHV